MSDARGGSSCDYVSRLQGHDSAQIMNYFWYAKDHVSGRGVLAKLLFNPCADGQIRRILQVIFCDYPRPHRREGIEAFSFRPLLQPELDVPCRDIVQYGLTEND